MESILTGGQVGFDDGTNVELAIKVREHIKGHPVKDQRLKIHIHLNEFGLARQLEHYPKFFMDYSAVEFVFFSVHDLAARLYLSAYPPDMFADVANHERVHLAIYDFKQLAQKLIIEAALIGHCASGARLRVSVFDEQATYKQQRFFAENPYIQQICDIQIYDQSALGAASFSDEVKALLPSVTQHIICAESEALALKAALILRATLLEQRDSNAPIMVRMNQSSGLAQLLESNTGESEIPDGLYPFGMLEQVLQAKMEHARYVATKRYEGWRYGEQRLEAARVNPFLMPWEDLPADQQHDETRQAMEQAVYFSEHGVAYTQRRFVIGVTGHRFDETGAGIAALQAQ